MGWGAGQPSIGRLLGGRRVAAADYFVAKTGSDSNDGSQGSPWLTLAKAETAMAAGRTVSVGPGTYNERVTISADKSGTAASPTRFIADGAVVVAQGFEIQSDYTDIVGFEITPGSTAINDASWRGQVWVRGSYVNLIGLNIHDCTYASAICLGSTEDHIAIESCRLTNAKHCAIGTDNGGAGDHAHDVSVRDCLMTGWGGGCAIMAYGDDWLIEGCTIRGINAGWNSATSQDGDGIWPNFSNRCTIRRCRIYDIWQAVPYSASGWHSDCIQFWVSCNNLLVDSCVLGSWKPGGFDSTPGPMNLIMAGTCSTSCSITVQNSVFMDGIVAGPDIRANAHTFCAAISSGTLTVNLYNNTFFGNAPAFSGTGTMVYKLRNNAFYAHRAAWWKTGSDSNYNAFLWNQWSDAAFTGLQASSLPSGEGGSSLGRTYETRLVAADLFTNPNVTSAYDYGLTASFKPKAGSVLIGAGEYNAAYPQYDITGAPRANPPSIGAYE